MSKESRKNGLLLTLEGLREELRDAMDAVDCIIDEVTEAKDRETMVDALSGMEWDTILENADYINGSVSVLKDLRLVMEDEELDERSDEEDDEEV